jgi:hypothetical protein
MTQNTKGRVMRIKAEDVKAGDVIKDRGTVATVHRWVEFVDITWACGGNKDTFYESAVLTVERSSTEELITKLDGLA